MDADFLSFADVLGDEAEAPKTDASSSKASKSKKDKSSLSSSRTPGNKRKRTLSHSDEDIAATPWVTKVDWNPRRKKASEQLHAEVVAFYEYLRPTRGEHALRQRIISDIGHALRFKFKDATVEPFGSYNTKLYLPSGSVTQLRVLLFLPCKSICSRCIFLFLLCSEIEISTWLWCARAWSGARKASSLSSGPSRLVCKRSA